MNVTVRGLQTSKTTVITKTVEHRWGVEAMDTHNYTVGRNGERAWVVGYRVDLQGPVELLNAIALAIQEVLDEPIHY